ncbi:MAG: DUF1028 domain-containing protein [Bauldia sp.]
MFNKRILAAAAAVTLLTGAAYAEPGDYKYQEPSGTYSIVAFDPDTGELGVAVQSNTISVGSRVRWGRAGVAAIASQASSNPMMGEIGVLLIQRGFTAVEARDMLVAMDNGAANRQFAIVDTEGNAAGWTGEDTSGWAGHICALNFCVEANTMTGPEVVNDMATAYMTATGEGLPLAERLLAALEAAEAAGGDRRGTQSAGLMIFREQAIAGYGDWALDIRVDESQAPIPELRRIYNANIAGQATQGLAQLIEAGNYEEALVRINAALALDPLRDAAYLQMADVYLAMGDTAAAIEALAMSIELNPKAFNQILRDDDFEPIWADPAFLALGDVSLFHPLEPSVFGGEGMPLPAMENIPAPWATPAP